MYGDQFGEFVCRYWGLRVEAIPVTASNPNDLAVCTVYHTCSHVTPSWRIVHQGSSQGLGPWEKQKKYYIIINSLSVCDVAHFHPWLQFHVPT